MKQPIATLTNLFYGLAAWYAYLADQPIAAGAFLLLMLGSAWYHIARSRWSKTADEMGIYGIILALLVVAYPISAPYLAGLWVVLLLLNGRASKHRAKIMTALGLCVIFIVQLRAGLLPTLGIVLVMLAALGARDFGHSADDPHGGYSFISDLCHGLWHGLTAAGLYLALTQI